MKLLTIGIDGGDRRIIEAMPMPALHSILDENTCIELKEDLWSRGWAEILSGCHGRETGAFYTKPLLDGTHAATQAYKCSDYEKSNITPFWKKLNNMGYRVGLMNVPTMMPAPEVDGFAVSGGGAGSSASGAAYIPEHGCFPKSIKPLLVEKKYILDIRFTASKIKEIDIYFSELILMAETRTKVFLELCRRYDPQFGFIAYMPFNRVQNLAMSEIEALMNSKCCPNNRIQEKILDFYAKMDNIIERLVRELSNENIMLVSDHGQSPKHYTLNMNSWLKENGFQYKRERSKKAISKATGIIKSFFPKSVRLKIQSAAPSLKEKVGIGLNVDWAKTTAFGIRYVPGIYINDRDRFNGKIENHEAENLIKKIIEKFNRNSLAKQHNLHAVPYRKINAGAKHEALLPDIWIEHPDDYFFEQEGDFLHFNENYKEIKDFAGIHEDMFTGIKGRHPLLCVNKELSKLVDPKDDRDLTLAHKLIVRGVDS